MSMGGSRCVCPIIMLILSKNQYFTYSVSFDSILSFKLDVLKTLAPTTEKNSGYEFLSASIIKMVPITGRASSFLEFKKSNFNPN